jgi:hypothetical protein
VCVRRPEDLFTAGRAGTARKEECVRRGVIQGGPVQQAVTDHAPQQAGTARKAGRASTGGLKVRSVRRGGLHVRNSSVTAGQWARWCVRDKMAEQCVVGECFCGRCSDLQLIVYRLLVQLSL